MVWIRKHSTNYMFLRFALQIWHLIAGSAEAIDTLLAFHAVLVLFLDSFYIFSYGSSFSLKPLDSYWFCLVCPQTIGCVSLRIRDLMISYKATKPILFQYLYFSCKGITKTITKPMVWTKRHIKKLQILGVRLADLAFVCRVGGSLRCNSCQRSPPPIQNQWFE